MIPIAPHEGTNWVYARRFRVLADHGKTRETGPGKLIGNVPYIGFMPRFVPPEPYSVSYGLHAVQHNPLYRYHREFLWGEGDPVHTPMLGLWGTMFIRKSNMVGFDEARMKTFWEFESGSWVVIPYATDPPPPIVLKFNADAARDEFVRFLTNLFGDWHFHLSAQERSLDDAKNYVKRKFAQRLHDNDVGAYPKPPALRDLPAFDERAVLDLRKLRNGKPADTATLEELAWRTECGVKEALKDATTEAELLAVVETLTEGVLTAAGFNDTSDKDAFWTIRDGISPVWQHDIIDQGNAYLAAESRLLAGYLNTESHHPAPIAVIEAVAKSVGGIIHTRSVRVAQPEPPAE